MPLIYVDLIEGRTPAEVQALLDTIHEAMLEDDGRRCLKRRRPKVSSPRRMDTERPWAPRAGHQARVGVDGLDVTHARSVGPRGKRSFTFRTQFLLHVTGSRDTPCHPDVSMTR
jgi:hypothetical protein